MAEKHVRVAKDAVSPESDEVIAKSIIDISEAMKRLNAGPLKRDTIVLLISKSSKVSQVEVGRVLIAMDTLRQTYLKPGR